MADLIFPSNPATGQEFTGTFGEVFTWDGIKWTLTALGAPVPPPPPTTVGSTPPSDPATGDLWFNTNNSTLNVWNGVTWLIVSPATPVSLSGTSVPIVFTYSGIPLIGTTLVVPIAIAMTIPANLTGSVGRSLVAATAAAAFTLNRNGAAIGTASIAASATTFTFSGAGASLVVGDVLSMVAPATADTTLANIGLSILATRA